MTLMQRWISGKIDSDAEFPIDPADVSFAMHQEYSRPGHLLSSEDWMGVKSGFPRHFEDACRLIFRQIFRGYAHLYWNHLVDPFYHLGLEKQLNSRFGHFLLTTASLDMLQKEDVDPMQHLIDLWAAEGTFPPDSRAYSYANLTSA